MNPTFNEYDYVLLEFPDGVAASYSALFPPSRFLSQNYADINVYYSNMQYLTTDQITASLQQEVASTDSIVIDENDGNNNWERYTLTGISNFVTRGPVDDGGYQFAAEFNFNYGSIIDDGPNPSIQPPMPCFASATRLMGRDGIVAVEDVRPGDILTTTAGTAAVVWIGHRRVKDTYVIHFYPGSLPVGPDRDLYVSEDHAMFLDGVLVPAGLLVNGETITREHRETVTFWHVELEAHGILLAEGAPVESYLDTGNRRQYGNCPLAYEPVHATQDPCVEMVLAGARLEELRALVRQGAERSFALVA